MAKNKMVSLLMRSNKFIKVMTYILMCIVIYGVSNTSVYYTSLMPFGVSVVFALLYIGYNGYYLSIVYFVAYVLAGLSLNSVFEALNVCLVLSCFQCFYNKKSKIKIPKWQIFAFSLLAQVVFILLNIGDVKENLALFVSLILGQLFLYASMCFFEAVKCKEGRSKISIDEIICGAVVLIIFIAGMSVVRLGTINLGIVFAILMILIFTFVSKPSILLIVAALSGVGFGLLQLTHIYISLFVFLSLCSLAFKCNIKVFSVLSVVLGFILFSLFFNIGLAGGEILSVCIGGALFILIPVKTLVSYDLVVSKRGTLAYNNIISNNQKQLIKRLTELSLVFGEMTGVYKSMVRGVLDDKNAMLMLKQELISSVCNGCVNFETCFRMEGTFIDNALDNIVSVAYDKGKILLIDVPQHLTTNCIKNNLIINTLNSLVSTYKNYTDSIKNLDTSRVLIADQLQGVSSLLEGLAKEVNSNINIQDKISSRIVNCLLSKDIECVDCLVYEKDISTKYITLIVSNSNIADNTVEHIVSKCVSQKMQIVSKESISSTDLIEICLETVPNFDIAIGCSVAMRSGKKVCGDSHSFARINNGRFMISICDGMGSGNKARDISSLTISLIEKFYKAGFENDIIINSINKLLGLIEEENYSTIDLCVIDAKKNVYDFIKLGACNGYLKRDNGDIEIIKSSNLPIGVLEDIRPHITRRLISAKDILIFVSDGVYDSFAGECDLKDYINSLDIINPQTLSDTIMNKALSYSDGVARDDMTVLCVRVFEIV